MKKIFLLSMLLLAFQFAAFADPTDTGSQVATTDTTTQSVNPAQPQNEPVNAKQTTADTCKCATLIPLSERGKNEWPLSVLLVFMPAILFVIAAVIIIKYCRRDFNLSQALSENIIEKITIPNTQYNVIQLSNLIAAAGNNASIVANLSALFPTTIEVSNISGASGESKIDISNVLLAIEAATSADASATTLESTAKATAEADKAAADKAATDARTAATTAANSAIAAIEAAKTVVSEKTVAAGGKVNASPDNYRASSSRLIAFMSSILTIIITLSMSCFYFQQYMYTGCPPNLSPLSNILIALGFGAAPYTANKIADAYKNKKTDSQ